MAGSDLDRLFAGAIPEIYDRYLVPLIFDGYARDLAARVQACGGTRVLEIAAGTGVVTRAMAAAMPDAEVTATDLNQAMLDHAARTDIPGVRWRQADALALPFGENSFDTVVCQFGVMFFPDRITAYRESLRVLAPGGHFVFNTWDRVEDNEFAQTVAAAVASVFPLDPPSFVGRTPHGYHDLDLVRRELAEAGFTDVRTETVSRRSRALTARDVALAYCTGTPLRNEIEQRDPALLDEAVERSTLAIATRFGTTNIDGKIQAHVIEASR